LGHFAYYEICWLFFKIIKSIFVITNIRCYLYDIVLLNKKLSKQQTYRCVSVQKWPKRNETPVSLMFKLKKNENYLFYSWKIF
jgi:hypothetical protein